MSENDCLTREKNFSSAREKNPQRGAGVELTGQREVTFKINLKIKNVGTGSCSTNLRCYKVSAW